MIPVDIEFDIQLDTRGLVCPQPLLQAKKALATAAAGQVLLVVSTDSAAPLDFKVFAEVSGHRLLAIEKQAGSIYIWLQKALKP